MVDDLPDFGVVRLAGDMLPTGILWNPEHMFCCIFVAIFFKAVTFGNKLIVSLLETITDIFEENKTKNHILIFRCSQITTKFIGTVPDTVFNRFLFDYLCFLCHSIEFFYFSVLLSKSFGAICGKELCGSLQVKRQGARVRIFPGGGRSCPSPGEGRSSTS